MTPGAKPADFSAAAILVQPFTLYLLAMGYSHPPSPTHWDKADPILLLYSQRFVLISVPFLGLAAALVWWKLARPDRQTLRRALGRAALGALLGCLVTCLLRLLWGPHLPGFIPAEENAGPGPTLSMTAGYAEEVLFRLSFLPLVYYFLARRVSAAAATSLAVVATGLGFALLHEMAHPTWQAPLLTTRFLVPGVAMSLAALFVGPAFIVSWHCASHLLLPLLFEP